MNLRNRTQHGWIKIASYATIINMLFQPVAGAATWYWDTTVPITTGGLGTPSGTWGTDLFWSTSSAGTGASTGSQSTSAEDVFFNSTGGGSIGVNGNVLASSITFGTAQAITLIAGGGASITIGGTGVNSGIYKTGDTAASVIGTDIVLNSTTAGFTIRNSPAAGNPSTGSLTLGKITGAPSATQTLTVGGLNTGGITINDVIANGAGGTVALTVDGGNNPVKLTALNTYTGATTLRRGTLNLDFSAQADNATNLIPNSNTIEFAGPGGRLLLTGKTTASASINSQAFATTTYTSGAIAIALTSGTQNTVNFDAGSVTRANNLTLDLTNPTSGSISLGNSDDATGIVGPWVTVTGYTDYAKESGSTVAALGVAGSLQSTWTSATGNYTLNTAGTETLTDSRTLNTLRFINTGANRELSLGGDGTAFDLTVNGVLNGNTNTKSLTISRTGTATGSVVIGSSNELVLLGRNAITISAPVKTTANQKITLGNNSAVSTALVSLTGGLDTTAAGVTIVVNGNNANVLSGTMSGTASTIHLTGPGTLSLGVVGTSAHSFSIDSSNGGTFTFGGSTSSYSGSTTLTAGTLAFGTGTGSVAYFGNGGTVYLNGGSFVIPKNNGTATFTNPFVMSGVASVVVRTSGTGTNGNQFSAPTLSLSGTPSITFVNTTLADNLFTFNFNTLRFAQDVSVTFSGENAGMNNRASYTASSVGVELLGPVPNGVAATIVNNVSHPTGTGSGTAAVRLGGAFSGGAAGQVLRLTGSGQYQVVGLTAAANDPGIEIDSTGVVYFMTTASTFTGGITLQNGTLEATTANTLPLTGVVTINGGTIRLASNQEIAGLNGSGGTVINPGGLDYVCTLSGIGTYSSAVALSPTVTSRVRVTKDGTGTQTLSGTSTYTGTTTVRGGYLVAGSNSSSGSPGAFGGASSSLELGVAGGNQDAGILIGGAFTVGRGISIPTSDVEDTGTRVLSLGGNTAHASEFSGAITLGTTSQSCRGVTLTAANGGTVTFSGVIANPTTPDATTYTVTKSGAGTVILTRANTYTGSTSVDAGTLTVNNTTGSGTGTGAVSVNNSAVLTGTGTISGAVTANDNGTVGFAGTLSGAVTVNETATLSPHHTAVGTLSLATNLTFASTAKARFTLSDTYNGSNDRVTMAGANAILTGAGATIEIDCGATLDEATAYVLFDLTVGSASVASDFAATPSWGGTPPAHAAGFTITTVGNQVRLVYAPGGAAPEIAVTGNGVDIPGDGSNVPGTVDYTDFADVAVVGGTLGRTFTIANIGSIDLNLTGTPKVVIGGTHAGDFAVTQLPTSPVAASGTTPFQVTFDPLGVGERVATVMIASDDADEGTFLFNIKGTGTADSFVSAAAGAYDANATWMGGLANPANGMGELVTIGHAVYVANAAHSTNDQIALTAGGSLEARGVSPSASSLDLSAGDASLLSGNASSDDGTTRTITLDAVSGARLTLGGGRTTTLGVGANLNNNTPYGITVNTGNGTTSTLNGTHTFNVGDNGTGLGTLTFSQAIVGMAAVQDTIVKTGTGRLTFNADPSLNVGDGDRINIEAGSVAMVAAPANLTVNFVNSGVVLRSDSITWPASTTLAFQTDGFLTANRGDYSPTYSSKFTGSGSITVSSGRTHTFSPDASSTWNGVLIVGNGGSGIARIGNAALTPVSVTMRGAATYDVVVLSSEAVDVATGFLIVNTPAWSVGGISNHAEGDPKNTRIGSRGAGLARTLTINVANGQTFEYQGALANGIRGDTSTLALVKAGAGTQILSGQTGPSCYSGGTAVNTGTLVVKNGSEAVTKTTTGGNVSNDSTANFTIADTTGLFVGQPVSGHVEGRVLISAISGTTVTIANRSGALVTIPDDVTFAATSPTGAGAVTVASEATLAGTGRIAGNVTVSTGGLLKFDKTTGAADTPLRIGGSLTLNNTAVTVEVLGSPLGNGTYVIASANTIAVGSTVNATPAITGVGLGNGPTVAATVAIVGNNLGLTVSGVVDTTDPEWVTGWPKVDTIGSRNFSVRYKVNEAGTGYFVVLLAGSTAPNATQVSEGKDSGGNAVALSGSSSLVANTDTAVVVSGLTKTTGYDVHFVAKDLAGNLQDSPSLVSVTTLDDIFSWDGDTSVAWADGANWNMTGVMAPANNLTDDTANFNQSTYTYQPTVSGARSIKGITVGNSSAAVTVNGASSPTLTIGAGGVAIANGATGAFALQNTLPITLGAPQTWVNHDDTAMVVNGAINNNGHLLTVELNNGTANRGTIDGNIIGTGGLRKTGTAQLTLSAGSYGFTGGLEIAGGYVILDGLTLDSVVTVTSGGFGADANPATIRGLNGVAGTYVRGNGNGDKGLAINTAAGQTYDFAGVVGQTKSFTFTKSGSGTQILSGSNINTGTTAVNGGTLLINCPHTGGGAYTVAAGATLGGSGSIPSSVTLGGTGALSPGGDAAGDTAATMTIAGDLTFAATSSARFDLGSVASDKVVMAGASAVLTGAGAKVRISAAAMDGRSQYVLFELTGTSASIASDFDPVPEWIGARPAGAGGYRVTTQGRRVLLQQHGMIMTLR